ncbi:hypothetical protein COV23_02070 [Candidatus Wolfebacteria bacterium CG10_big_fil_rev_8_21_14_0_10_31_9]|uniref:LamG-like jellyroll fold domain-containing protein n=1 Tax=Candidatus Wolfebacteria bacterium CG10_big_fil_rev_8_21_14_0_10_31_9 TaxID=1975070 RepID=A0A2H0RC02_9BACT|nr:MAG: hypothetical protein COV23_02070 [Candidatus Wolfebacteria bacterium CG10_big_fil_rev_8_21_14_0_10_31_9]
MIFGLIFFNSITEIELNKWYYVTFTLAPSGGGNNAKIYINGILKSEAHITTPVGTGGNTKMSYRIQDDIDWFDGYVDELKIYSRVLSATEINTIYNSTK